LTALHPTLTDEIREQAILCTLRMLDGREEHSYEAHLRICDVCRNEVRANEEAAALISLAAPAVQPPASLKKKVLARADYVVARAGDGGWTPFAAPGIERKTLAHDPVSGSRTFLLRLQPGAVLPAHDHGHCEHCYVLEGEVFDDDHGLSAGDYELRLPGSKHPPVRTNTGATVLIIVAE